MGKRPRWLHRSCNRNTREARLLASSFRPSVRATFRRQALGTSSAGGNQDKVAFNLIVGSAGILSGIVVGVLAMGASIPLDSDFGLPDPPAFALVGMLLDGVMANTRGWLVVSSSRAAYGLAKLTGSRP
jgi:hypothetical protein